MLATLHVLLSSIIGLLISAVILVVLIAAGTYAVMYMIDRRRYVINGKLPGYKKWPIVGDILHMERDPAKFQRQVEDLASRNTRQGVWYFRAFLRDVVALTNPNEIEKLLGSSTLIDKGMEYKFVVPWLGVSLLTGGGQLWRSRRKLLTPSFHFNILRDFLPVIVENSIGLKDELAMHADTDEAIDITKYTTLTTLDIINDMLLDCKNEDGTPLTDDEIRAEVDTFMFEGHDTTSAAIERCLYLLGENVDEQRKCQEEIDNLFGGARDFTWNDLSKLPYLECCIKEAMRIYPVVPSFSRRLSADTTFGGYNVAKGTTVMIMSNIIHRSPNIYDDPERFDPTRFTLENSSKRHPYAYIPFSAGPRNCIGQKLAMMEMKIVISTLLRSFNIESIQTRDEIVDNPSVVLESVSGIWLKLASRF